MFDIKRRQDENEQQYLWRLGRAKDAGIIDLSWDGIAAIINSEFRDETEYRTECAYRKAYSQAKKFFDSDVFKELSDEKCLKELQIQKQELEKEKIKVRDERNELKRLLREQSRKENYIEQVIRSISEHQSSIFDYDKNKKKNNSYSESDLIISCTDIHAGIEIDNFFNKFNEEILERRFSQYLDKIFEVQDRHGSKNAYVILSELISGLIHNELRIESNQNIIEQFLMVSDYISKFLSELSYSFDTVNVYINPGNHSRISPNKDDSLKGENIDHFAIPYLEAKLQNFKNIYFHRNNIEESIAMFNVRGYIVMSSHGDKDNVSTVVQKFTMMFSMKPDLVYLGHRHTNGMTTVYDTKVIQSGCLSGSDNYCMDKRLKNRPEQTISVITENGLDCLYDVKFY